MNIRYYHEFRGADNVLYRFEILTPNQSQPTEIKCSAAPFILKYEPVKKLTPVRGSQSTLELISEINFQFVDLHTDDMQGYMVKFYKEDKLYWVGWLDSELYNEQLSAYPPYEVQFSAADFNITERLKYLDSSDIHYTDIAPFITHLKRCFDKLNLPFQKLYIGCTTIADGIPLSVGETALHVLFMMSANFYDEDNEPMTCREVIESILQPFGLILVQKDANVYIYDLNTIKKGLPMKRYDFASFGYEGEEVVNFNHGNLLEIGFMSTEGDYGFEEMANNVTITSSLYATNSFYNESIDEDSLESEPIIKDKDGFNEKVYQKDKNIENLSGNFLLYEKDDSETTLIGAILSYDPLPTTINPIYRIKVKDFLIPSKNRFYLNISGQIYINTRINPFDSKEEVKTDDSSRVIRLYCNLYLTDTAGKPIMYFNNDGMLGLWTPCDGSFPQGKFCMLFLSNTLDNHDIPSTNILNRWITNSDQVATDFGETGFRFDAILEKNYQKGINVALRALGISGGQIAGIGVYGNPVFEITNKCLIDNPTYITSHHPFPIEKVTNILINDISITIKDKEKKEVSTDDYEFNSYVNKKVYADYEEITLKCISANEESAPVGRANILKRTEGGYELQLSYSRGGQTNILERLLMCTIHSNYTTKNEQFSCVVKNTGNPILSYIMLNPILSKEYLVYGCTIDFNAGKTTISAVGYSEDVAKLSNIPYD